MTVLDTRAATAVKWSALAESAVKLIAPLSSMLIARILSPDAFGVASVAVVIMSFAEIITDSGFNKFIIRHPFRDEQQLYRYAATAHRSNIILAVIITAIIILLSRPISAAVGIGNHRDAIVAASAAIPFMALRGIPSAVIKRNLYFRSVFRIRMLSAVVPLAVTLPCALLLHSYMAIIAGYVASYVLSGIGYFALEHSFSGIRFNFRRMKRMLRFSLLTIVESTSVWLTAYIDIFIISLFLSKHFVGIYRTAMVTSGQILGLITASVLPVLFSALSRASGSQESERIFLKFQKHTAFIVAPAGMMLFLFSGETTAILLGEQWREASLFIGLWSLTSIPVILISHFSSEIYRASGKPEYSVVSQMLHLAAIVPVIYLFIGDFGELCHARALVRLQGVIVNMIMLQILCGINARRMLSNIMFPIVAASCMLLATVIPASDSVMIWLIRPAAAIAIYLAVISLSSKNRSLISGFYKTSMR